MATVETGIERVMVECFIDLDWNALDSALDRRFH